MTRRLGSVVALMLWLASGASLLAQSYAIPQSVVAGGGGSTTGGTYAIVATVGEPGAGGALTTGSYSVTGGFWSFAGLCPGITLSATPFAAGQSGTAYPATTVTQTGGAGTVIFTLTAGALPAGMTVSSGGTVSGTPTQAGDFSFTLTATDANGCKGSRAYSLTVAAAGLPVMSLERLSLFFGAISNATAFTSQTSAQIVRLRQVGAGTVTWTAVSNAPWLVVSPASGSGPAPLTISTQFASGLTTSQTGTVTLTFTGAANSPGPIAATLTIVPNSTTVPFGVFDTPAGDATVLAGSIAVTGWALDNVGVQRVELWRDLQPGETTPPFTSTPTDPRNGKVFISNATFVDNARPDVEALYPTTPFKYRAGWGYLLLTWGLWNQGNGTYKLYAYAFDQENNLGTIGTKTIIVSNNAATKPFGSIDTPAIGGEASGPNFGWGLTPKVNGVATCKIQPSGVQVSIDSGPLQPVVYGDARTDIAGAFTGFSNSAAAGGHYIFDWSSLSNGTHTIGWLITDDCNRADGVGSRFFQVSSGSSLTAAVMEAQRAVAAPETESTEPITVAHGYGELPVIVTPGEAGSRTIEVAQNDRIEVRVPRGFETAYQLGPGGERRALPTGATWDATSGTLSWQPAPGFLGRYRIVFTNGHERISIRIVVVLGPGL